MENLHEKLIQLENSDYYPFHMPGHKRQAFYDDVSGDSLGFSFYKRDITEIDGFDNLHHAENLLKDEQKKAAYLFESEKSYFLVNGSSCGILSAIMTVCHGKEEPILMCRNAHASAYHALELAHAKADFIYPEILSQYQMQGCVSVEQIKKKLSEQKFSAVFITSPTYEGILSDVRQIARLAHAYQIPLIVDEAHGAHLGFFHESNFLPESAIACGADIVIESLHKTLPAMTQTAILHKQGTLIADELLEHYLRIFQSSSPSYIMMDSMTMALSYCDKNRKALLACYKENLKFFYEMTKSLHNLQILTSSDLVFAHDPGKIVIFVGPNVKERVNGQIFTGKKLYDVLRETYHLQMEMANSHYVIAMTSVMDLREGFERLAKALIEIDQSLDGLENTNINKNISGIHIDGCENYKKNSSLHFQQVHQEMTIKDASLMKKKLLTVTESEMQVCGEYVYQYPPDIPVLVPGEVIFRGFAEYVEEMTEMGIDIKGICKDKDSGKLLIPVLNI